MRTSTANTARANTTTTRPAITASAAPGRDYPALTWAPAVLLLWALAYGALRVYWAAGNAPEFEPLPHDLVVFTGWGPAGLCAAAAVAAAGLLISRTSRTAVAAAWLTAGAMAASCPLLLLDVIGAILPGLGLAFDVPSVLGRVGMAVAAALMAFTAVAYRRRMTDSCGRCGRQEAYVRRQKVPAWAFAAAYIAVAGCLIRLAAQYLLFDSDLPFSQGLGLELFSAGFLLAGTVLPLALVHRWGRLWPRWVLGLAGRRVPRWLVLGPAFFVAVGLTLYFGLGTAELGITAITGVGLTDTGAALDSVFLWVSVPAYLVWGLGLGVAAVARLRQTRPECTVCGA